MYAILREGDRTHETDGHGQLISFTTPADARRYVTAMRDQQPKARRRIVDLGIPATVTADRARRLWDGEPIRNADGFLLVQPAWLDHLPGAEDMAREGRWQEIADAVNSWLTMPR